MPDIIPNPDLTGRGRDGIPLPKNELHNWWLAHGIPVCTVGFAISLALMVAGTYMQLVGLPHPEEYQRWGLWIGVANVLAYLDVLTQRVIRRLTQIIAMFTTDVAPMQNRSGDVDVNGPFDGQGPRLATIIDLYKDVKKRSSSEH